MKKKPAPTKKKTTAAKKTAPAKKKLTPTSTPSPALAKLRAKRNKLNAAKSNTDAPADPLAVVLATTRAVEDSTPVVTSAVDKLKHEVTEEFRPLTAQWTDAASTLTVASEDDFAKADHILNQLKITASRIDVKIKSVTRPIREVLDDVYAFARSFSVPLENAELRVKHLMGAYRMEEDRRIEKERREREEAEQQAAQQAAQQQQQ